MVKAKKKAICVAAIILCAAIVIGLVSYDFIKSSNTVESTFLAMGTVITTSISGKDADAASEAVEEALLRYCHARSVGSQRHVCGRRRSYCGSVKTERLCSPSGLQSYRKE